MLVKVDAELVHTMVHVCVVPGRSNRSDRETHLSYHCLPLKNRRLLKIWEHKIGRKNLPKTVHSRVCNEHFINSKGRILIRGEVPTLNLPKLIGYSSSASIKEEVTQKAPLQTCGSTWVTYMYTEW